jgi:hypothetical protein
MDEEWRIIPGYTNYEASSLGRIRRCKPGWGVKNGKIMKLTHKRYTTICLVSDEGKSQKLLVHRLILFAFKGQPPTEKHEGAHWDGVTSNNSLSNLRWATHKENGEDLIRHGTGKGNRGAAKITEDDVKIIRRLYKEGLTIKGISDKLPNIHYANIWCIAKERSWKGIQ